ncbi:MAG TPA: PEGA domain-containing protein, partial [Thermoanaerobaculia bacterium]|nr:PEGA domain-containing protein [Thermoanaerobaculia bacterium]
MSEGPTHQPHEVPEPALFPKWVPLLIGLVLVALGALVVFTGLRYRTSTLVNMVRPRPPRPAARPAPAPPGEPEAGGSLMSGDNTPVANEPVNGKARAVITGGGAEGVASTVRIWARRGMTLSVVPADAVVYVNDVAIGEAKQFDGPDEVYDFAQPGSYTVRLVAPGYKEAQYVVTAADDAKTEVARIEAK